MINKKNSSVVVPAFFVVLGTALSFLPSLSNGFIRTWDDTRYLLENSAVQVLSFANTKNIFSTFFHNMYQPLVLLSYSIEYHFFGFHPAAYHTTNLIFHLLNTLWVFWIIFILTRNSFICFVTALLFGIHPLHVESVAWVTERKDMLYSFFFLGALVVYLYYRRSSQKKLYVLCLVLFVLSLMAKPAGVSLPLILLLFDFRMGGHLTKKLFFEKAPFFALAFVFGVMGLIGQRSNIHQMHGASFSSVDNFFYAAYAPLFYLGKLFLPVRLSCLYPRPIHIGGFLPVVYLFSPSLLLMVLAGAIFLGRYSRKIIFGTFFFFITILPALEIIPISPSVVFDRYTYIPSIGLFYLIAEGVHCLHAKGSKFTPHLTISLMVLLATTFGTFSYLTWNRCKVWKDSLTLWTDVLKNYPNAETAYLNRGNEFKLRGRLEEAVSDYKTALEINPGNYTVLNNLGNIYSGQGNYSKAERYYRRAISLNPRHAEAYHNLGIVYENEEKYELAYDAYHAALRIDPELWGTYMRLGNWHLKKKNFNKAAKMYERGLHYNPVADDVLLSMGVAYAELNNISRAESIFQKYIQKYPDSVVAMKNLGALYGNTGRLLEAKKMWEKVLKIDPRDVEIGKKVREINKNIR